jgi:hypothetical protein
MNRQGRLWLHSRFIVRIRISQEQRIYLKNRNRNRNRNNLLLWFRVMIRQIEGVNSRRTHPACNGAGCR